MLSTAATGNPQEFSKGMHSECSPKSASVQGLIQDYYEGGWIYTVAGTPPPQICMLWDWIWSHLTQTVACFSKYNHQYKNMASKVQWEVASHPIHPPWISPWCLRLWVVSHNYKSLYTVDTRLACHVVKNYKFHRAWLHTGKGFYSKGHNSCAGTCTYI